MFSGLRGRWSDRDGAKWWNVYGREWPKLCIFARRILTQPVASSCSERGFSAAKAARGGASRARQDVELTRKLVRVRQFLRQQVDEQVVQTLNSWYSNEGLAQRDPLCDPDEEELKITAAAVAADPAPAPAPAAHAAADAAAVAVVVATAVE